jgi:branched-chain amino acid transport system permease protein
VKVWGSIAEPLRRPLGSASGLALPVVVTLVGLVLARVQDEFQLDRSAVWLSYGLLALSLDLVWGQAGIFSFGQTAFFGVAGYTYGVLTINLVDRTGESTTAILGAVVVAATLAALLGYFMFYGRVSDVYLAIITLAATLVLLSFFASTADRRYTIGEARLGGYNGMTGIRDPITLGLPGLSSVPLDIEGTYVFMVLLAGTVYVLLTALLRSPFGRVLRAVRENEWRTELLGYDTRRYKLLAFTLGGAIAGLGGATFTGRGFFINPAVFSLPQAALLVIWVLVGGRGTMVGPFLGVALVEWMRSELGGRTEHTPLVLGLLLIVFVLLIPNGLTSLLTPALTGLRRRLRPRTPRAGPPAAARVPAPAGAVSGDAGSVPVNNRPGDERVLETLKLGTSFGGLKAVDGVTTRFGPGLHCLIGPNGAGKSTFFNLLVGRYRPTEGRITYSGSDITRLEPHQRARRGIGIKLQVPSIYAQLSVEENVWLAAYAACRDAGRATERAREVLGEVGLVHRAEHLAAHLAHGEQQWLEIGMVLAADPELILLDEPTAGMTREETSRTAELIARLARGATVVVVEHDMEFVRQLHAPVTVLHQGRVFKQGSLEELRRDEAVLNIYLGRRAHAAG